MRDIWDGRPVTFREFTIKEGKPVSALLARDGEEGLFAALVLSMCWADTATPVFAAIEEIHLLPYRFRLPLARLASKAARLNGLIPPESDDDDDEGDGGDELELESVPTNGHDGMPAGPPN